MSKSKCSSDCYFALIEEGETDYICTREEVSLLDPEDNCKGFILDLTSEEARICRRNW